MAYEVKEHLKPASLNGISEDQINQHWNLYKGYVNQVNALEAELESLRSEGKEASPAFTDRRRRYGFEYNGMVLHEWYFGNLKSGGSEATGNLKTAIEQRWGSIDAWKADFANTGKSRSIGWAILYMDPESKTLSNHFIQLHEEGNVAHFQPVLVMDVWEHAYMVDFGAGGRGTYIDQFFANVDMAKAEERYNSIGEGRIPVRG